jgi:S1-C subfamily serine protease
MEAIVKKFTGFAFAVIFSALCSAPAGAQQAQEDSANYKVLHKVSAGDIENIMPNITDLADAIKKRLEEQYTKAKQKATLTDKKEKMGQKQIKPLSSAEIAEKYKSAVVLVLYQNVNARTREIEGSGHGSGVIINVQRNGLPDRLMVLTNAHVVENKNSVIKVRRADKNKEYAGKVKHIGFKEFGDDFALIEVDDKSFFDGAAVARLADKALKQGEDVYIAGFPDTRDNFSFIAANISKFINDKNLPSLYLIISYRINGGNSGGPVFDALGNLVGIVRSVPSDGTKNQTYAIPSEKLERFLRQVRDGKAILPGFLGTTIFNNTDPSERPHIFGFEGVRPQYIYGTPLQQAGMEEGDIITDINGRKLDSNGYLKKDGVKIQIINYIGLQAPGDSLHLRYYSPKDSTYREVPITVGGEQKSEALEDILQENWRYYSTGGINFVEKQFVNYAGERSYRIYIDGVLASQYDYDSFRIIGESIDKVNGRSVSNMESFIKALSLAPESPKIELYGGHIFYINGRSKAADEELHGQIDPEYEESYVKSGITVRQ